MAAEECLPESADLFLSLVEKVTREVEGQLEECQLLVNKQVKTHFVFNCCETSPKDLW